MLKLIFCSSQHTIKTVKRQFIKLKRYSQYMYLTKDLCRIYIQNSYKFIRMKDKPNRTQQKNDKRLKKKISQKRTSNMAKKHMKRCSSSLVIRKLQIKTTVTYHYTPTRMAKIKKMENANGWWGCGVTKTCWWKCKLTQALWKLFCSIY